jgi:pimeloyl-ACP methyl ester carboxylesterase
METRRIKGFGFTAGRWPLDTDKTTLVFIHGSGGTSRFWNSQVDALATHANTIALDLPGHGRSAGKGFKHIEAYALAVHEFLDAVSAPNPIACGLSLGGAVTQQLLLDYPAYFRAGILIGTGAKLRVSPAILASIEKDYAGFVSTVGISSASSNTDPAVFRPFQEDLGQCNPETTLGDFRACDAFNVMDRLHEIQVPVLVITAEDDMLTPPKYGDFLEKHIQKTTRAHVKDAGHIVPMEKPGAVNGAILDFLKKNDL